MEQLTEAENKMVQKAVRGSLDLRNNYVGLFTEDAKMKRKQVLFRNKEIPLLKSALRKLRTKIEETNKGE